MSVRKPSRALDLVLFFCCVIGSVGCGGGGSSSTPPPNNLPSITAVVVSCSAGAVITGQTLQCSATVTGTGNFSSEVTWSTTAGTVSAGVLTAPATAGPVTITATSVADPTKHGTFVVTVTTPSVTSVSVSCAGSTVTVQQTLQCNATVSGTGNFDNSVTWSTTAGSISSSGLLTAPAAAGPVTVTATSVADSTRRGTATVTATVAPTITAVSVSCANASVPQGQTLQCTATVTGTGNFDPSVNWSTSAGTMSASGLLTAPATTGPVTVTATSVADPIKKGSFVVTISGPKAAFDYKGVSHVSWWNGEYSTSAAAASEAQIANTGSNWAGLLVTQYMPTKTANTIGPTNNTPTDADLGAAITQLHAKGLKVMLKPHVDVSDGSWRGQIAPASTTLWFQNFTSFIIHYAQLAQDNGVEMLCFGTEYASISGSANQAAWENVITAIRAVYGGKLAYAANATYSTDEFKSVSFWDSVDVIGLDAYFPLTNHADPTLAELVAAWSSNKNGENIVQDVVNFAAAHSGKPVIFTEIGYRSASGANIEPWNYSASAPADNLEQQNCYEAMYQVWSQRTSSLKGNFWWDWPVNPPAAGDTDYNPRNKPAEATMQNWLRP